MKNDTKEQLRMPIDLGLDLASPDHEAALSAIKIVASTYKGLVEFQQVSNGSSRLDVFLEFPARQLRYAGIAAVAYARAKQTQLTIL